MAQVQAKPGAAADILGGEERIENFVDDLPLDADPVILEACFNAFFLDVVGGGNDDTALFLRQTLLLDGIPGIHDQIHEHLSQFLRQPLERGEIGRQVPDDFQIVFDLVMGEHHRIADNGVQVAGTEDLFAVRHAFGAFHDVVDALDRLDVPLRDVIDRFQDEIHVQLGHQPPDLFPLLRQPGRLGRHIPFQFLHQFLHIFHIHLQAVHGEADRLGRVVDFMGNTGHHGAQGGQFFLLDDACLAFQQGIFRRVAVGDVPHHGDEEMFRSPVHLGQRDLQGKMGLVLAFPGQFEGGAHGLDNLRRQPLFGQFRCLPAGRGLDQGADMTAEHLHRGITEHS